MILQTILLKSIPMCYTFLTDLTYDFHLAGDQSKVRKSNKRTFKGELRHKINLWSNYTLVPSQPFSEICCHDNRM